MYKLLKSLGPISLLLVLSFFNTAIFAEEVENKKVSVEINTEEMEVLPTGNDIQELAGDTMDVDVTNFIRYYEGKVLRLKFYYQKIDNCAFNPSVNPEPTPEKPPVNPEPRETLPVTGSDSSNTSKAIILLAASSILLIQANKKQKIFTLIFILGLTALVIPTSIHAEEVRGPIEFEVINNVITVPVPQTPECTKVIAGQVFLPETGGDTSTNTED